jgi:predicted glycosyl hydrolase (DUF1957 family)
MKLGIFGSGYRRQGFYLPEMACSRRVLEILDRMGFEWVILDEIAFCGKLKSFDKTKVYKIKDLKLKAVFRNRTISDQFVPEKIKELSGSFADKETSIITATDGELYGHHHQDFYNMTREAFSDSNIRSYKVSDFVHDFGQGELEEADPVMSSWGSTEEDVAAGIPFSYWKEPENAIQDKLWQFADFACQEVESSNRDENYEVARGFLDKGFSSCHFWAASGKKSMVWKNVIWNPDVIEKGNLFFMKAVRSLYRMDTEKRLCAERRFAEINQMIWKNHWEKFYHF